MFNKNDALRFLLLSVPLFLMSGCGNDEESGAEAQAESKQDEAHAKGPEDHLPAAPTLELESGREVFVQVCSRCHIESEYAPTIGDTRDWKRRYARAESGVETLYDHAVNGFGDMLAKGGKRGKDLTDEQVKQAVDYAVAVTQAATPAAE